MAYAHTVGMDINEYAMEYLVRERLCTLRAAAARQALCPRAAPTAGVRMRLGGALIRAGQWLRAGAADRPHSQITHG